MNRILFQGFERVFVGCMALVKGAWGVRVGAGSGVSGGTPLPLCCAGAGIGGMRRPLANERGGEGMAWRTVLVGLCMPKDGGGGCRKRAGRPFYGGGAGGWGWLGAGVGRAWGAGLRMSRGCG
jgi:hypothetical protein